MNQIPLGDSSLQVSEMTLGCMSLRGSHRENAKILQTAFDLGITSYDTADLYDKGENEISVGKAFKGMRAKVMIATKVGNQWRPDGSGWDWNPHKAYILRAVEDSLLRLQTEYIDLYQLHGGTTDDPMDETIEAFERLKEQGKIREYGISSIRPNVIREYVNRSNIASNMMQYSLLDRRPEEAMLDLLNQSNIGVIVRGAVAKGLLLNKAPKASIGHSKDKVAAIQSNLSGLGTYSPLELAVGYVRKHPAIKTLALGCSSIAQLKENVAAMEKEQLPDDIFNWLQDLLQPNLYVNHR